jgi:hypothetical protein
LILAVLSALAALAQEGDALSTVYGLYDRKPPLAEGDIKSWNLGLVKHPTWLCIAKFLFGLAPTLPMAFFIGPGHVLGGGLAAVAFAAAPAVILIAMGVYMTAHNITLIKA